MATSEEYLQFVLEQLTGLGPVTARRMFGGSGLYLGEVFFGLISRDTLYFKVDDCSREEYVSRRMQPFRPFRDRPKFKNRISKSYFEVPVEVLEDQEQLVAWAGAAVKVGKGGTSSRRRR